MAGYGMAAPTRVMSAPKTPPMQVGMAGPQRLQPSNPIHAQIATAMGSPMPMQGPKQNQIGMFRGARGLAV